MQSVSYSYATMLSIAKHVNVQTQSETALSHNV